MEDIRKQLQTIIESSNWSQKDRQWLLQYLEQNDTSVLRELMQEQFTSGTGAVMNEERARQLLEKIHLQIGGTAKIVRVSFWKRFAAAAAVIVVLLSGSYFLFFNKETIKKQNPQLAITDAAPGGNKAVLTLSDNSVVILDNAQNGVLSQQGNTKVLKLHDGQIAYNTSGDTKQALYNTISTPRGGQYQMTLSDGSKVWLNSASSIKFPVAFTGDERKVEITGEAYFEVAKNASMPFKVNAMDRQEVEVLGTHFNINAYNDEATINTTLLEGKVKVSASGSGLQDPDSQLLSPGQQAIMSKEGRISLNKNADVDAVVAWKNGWFNFNNYSVENIMRQISRWYDVEVVYAGRISAETFTGIVKRNSNVSEVLKIMQEAGLKFKIDGKKIIVLE